MAIAGKVAITPKGEWNANTAYTKLDLVFFENASYVAIQPSTGVTPTNTAYWMLVVQSAGGADLEAIINGTTQVGNAKTLDGHGAEDFFPRSGGILGGPLEITENGNTDLPLTRVITAVGGISFLINVNPDLVGLRQLAIHPISSKADPLNALEYQYTEDGVIRGVHTVLHTGNKPLGMYTGNGDVTERRIKIGVSNMSRAVVILGGYNITIATWQGSVSFDCQSGATKYFTQNQFMYEPGTGEIVSHTSDVSVNNTGWSYDYQCL